MKKAIVYAAAVMLVVPAGFLLAASAVHLWRMVFIAPHSSSMFFGFGRFSAGAPWSHLLQTLFASATLVFAAVMLRSKTKKLLAWILGLAVIVTAFLATSVAFTAPKVARPNKAPEPTPTSVTSPAGAGAAPAAVVAHL